MKLRELYQPLNEDAVAQQEINAIGQAVINYYNSNPKLVKLGGILNLKDVPGIPKISSREVQNLIDAGQIRLVTAPNRSANGWYWSGKQVDMTDPNVAKNYAPDWYKDPHAHTRNASHGNIDDYARSDKAMLDKGMPQAKLDTLNNTIRGQIAQGYKWIIEIPWQRISGEWDGRDSNLRSTVVHELNHNLDALKGMDLGTEWNKHQANERARFVNDLKPFLEPNQVQGFDIGKLLKAGDPYVPELYKLDFFNGQIKIQTDYLADLAKDKATYAGSPELMAQVAGYEKTAQQRLKLYKVEQKQIIEKLKSIAAKFDPTIGVDYDKWSQGQRVEVNSRVQEVADYLKDKIKPGMNNQAIDKLVIDAFSREYLISPFVDPALIKQGGITDKAGTITSIDYYISKNQYPPEIREKVLSSARKNPEFQRAYTKTYKFIQQELANPMAKSVEVRKTFGDRFRAFMMDIPQEHVGQAILPGAKDVAKYQGQKIIYSIATSKGVAGAALWGVEKVLIPVAAAYAIASGIKEIIDLPDDLPQQEFEIQATKIIGRLVAEFGIGWVAAGAGATLAGLATAPTGIGAVGTALIGFVVGGVAGITANYFAGDTIKSVVDTVVDFKYNRLPQQRPQPAQVPQQPQQQPQRPQTAQPVQTTPRASAPKALAGQPALNYESLLHQLRK